jgi:anti-sigma factor RsiW
MTASGAPIGDDDLEAFIDGRLAPARRELVESYLADHPEIGDRVTFDSRIRDNLRARLAGKLAEPIPARLRIANIVAARRARSRGRLGIIAAALAIFFIGAGAGWMADRLYATVFGPTAATAPTAISIARDAAAAYRTFVVEVVHPVEVDAANQGHLLKWLSKRLGRNLTAPDLAKFGYRLMGGRLLPGVAGAAAQLMYEDTSGRRLTIYVEAAEGTETAFRFRQEGDAATFAWVDQGFGFAVTAREARDELLPIAEAIYRGLEGTRQAPPSGKG